MLPHTTREHHTVTDHDLLLVTCTKLDAIRADVNRLKTRIDSKADSARLERLSSRFARSERKLYTLLGGLSIIQVLLRLYH